MFQGQVRSAQEWGDLVRAASSYRGPWPKVSVWHGDADRTVAVVNAAEVIKQWTNVHGLPTAPSRQEIVDGHPRRVWVNAAGEDVVEDYIISGMSHGAPIAISTGEQRHGAAGPFSLDVGIPSSYHMTKFWGLTGPELEPMPSLPIGAEEVPASSIAQAALGQRNWPKRVRRGCRARPQSNWPEAVALSSAVSNLNLFLTASSTGFHETGRERSQVPPQAPSASAIPE